MTRDLSQLLQNMEQPLADFYRDFIESVQEGIRTYFPDTIDRQFFETVTGQVEVFEQDYDTLYKAIMLPAQEYLDCGGKVLRPILVALTLHAYGVDPHTLKKFLGSIEVMEDSSIMMDDYIDNSLQRRGGDCAHVRHGYPLANISSCTAFALSHHLFYNNELQLPLDEAVKLMNAFAWEHMQMAFGQIEELFWTAEDVNTVSISQYLQETIARCAFLSFRGPLRYAGMIAGAPAEDIPVLEKIGDYLLIGYHVRGDNLDMAPDSEGWGKIAGEDITTGRRTLLINHVLEKATPEDRAAIEEILNSRTRDEARKQVVYDLVMKYDGFGMTRRLAAEFNDRTKREIDKLHIDDDHRELFYFFSDFASMKRAL